jgi:hypothetical protein
MQPYLFAFDMNGGGAVLARFGGEWQDSARFPFGYFMLQVSSSTIVLSHIPHHTALSVPEAANVEDIARALLAASLSPSGAESPRRGKSLAVTRASAAFGSLRDRDRDRKTRLDH